ncbi:MAG: glucose-1-phosphate adenylyltransferase [Gemmataceae bacterium]|nr:glucose-1-phosphate adenylyltransferase [Gemmataceae bacterium]
MQDVLCLILGGGRGTRLYPLTKHRSEPAVPIAGKYRLIDIPISNCLNSGLNRIYVLTQYLSVSLHRHLSYTYKFDPFSRGFVEVLAAQQTNEAADWYKGTADAVRQNVRYVQDDPARDVLILSGDQLYRMDFRQMLKTHRDSKADVTIATMPVMRNLAARLGVLRADDTGRITQMVEKPQTDEQLAPLRTPAAWLEKRGVAPRGREYLANLGIYMFRRDTLFDLLNGDPSQMDFVLGIFPNSFATHRFQAHLFDDYWADLGTIKAFHEAHLALASDQPPFDFNQSDGVIYTRMRYLPASRISAARLEQSLVSDGCIIQAGAQIERCLVGLRSRIGKNVTVRDSVIIGADRVETEAERADNQRRGLPDFTIGDGSLIEHAILDKDCRIGRHVKIINQAKVQEGQGDNYMIRDGIVVIPNGAVVPDGSVI